MSLQLDKQLHHWWSTKTRLSGVLSYFLTTSVGATPSTFFNCGNIFKAYVNYILLKSLTNIKSTILSFWLIKTRFSCVRTQYLNSYLTNCAIIQSISWWPEHSQVIDTEILIFFHHASHRTWAQDILYILCVLCTPTKSLSLHQVVGNQAVLEFH